MTLKYFSNFFLFVLITKCTFFFLFFAFGVQYDWNQAKNFQERLELEKNSKGKIYREQLKNGYTHGENVVEENFNFVKTKLKYMFR